mgnify:CR=1 FL=1
MLDQYIPVLMQLGIATAFAVSTLLVSVLLGKSAKSNKVKDSAYECGMLPIGDAKPRFSVKFYVIAMLFVIFDIEVVFMYPWAVSINYFKEQRQAKMIFIRMSGYVAINKKP